MRRIFITLAIIMATSTGAAIAATGGVAGASAATALTPVATSGPNNFVAVSPDGSVVAAVSAISGVSFYDVATGDIRTYDLGLAPGAAFLGQPTFSLDGQSLYVPNSSSSPGYIYVVRVSDGAVTLSYAYFGESSPWQVALSADGSRLAVSLFNGRMVMLDMVGSPPPGFGAPFDVSDDNIHQMCTSPDRTLAYSIDYAGNDVDVVDIALGSVVDNLTAPGMNAPYSCTVDAEGNLYVGDYLTPQVHRFPANGSASTTSQALFDVDDYVGGVNIACGLLFAGSDNATLVGLDPVTLAPVAELTVDSSDWRTFSGAPTSTDDAGWFGGDDQDAGLVGIENNCPTPSPSLPDTGASQSVIGTSIAVSAGLLVAGALALIVVRRRQHS